MEGKEKRDHVKHDPVNHPSYYCGKIEVIDFIDDRGFDRDYYLASVIKYVSRAGKKNPATEIEDLKKARFYLDRKIQQLEGKSDGEQ